METILELQNEQMNRLESINFKSKLADFGVKCSRSRLKCMTQYFSHPFDLNDYLT